MDFKEILTSKTFWKIVGIAAAAIVIIVIINSIVSNHRKAKDGILDNVSTTQTVVREIREIGEYYTAQYYADLIFPTKVEEKKLFRKTTKEYVLVVKGGIVKAGFDFSKLPESAIQVEEDSVGVKNLTLNLPAPKILLLELNPSKRTIFYSDGDWSDKEEERIVKDARSKLESEALRNGILEKAQQNAIDNLSAFFKCFGYNEVTIHIAD